MVMVKFHNEHIRRNGRVFPIHTHEEQLIECLIDCVVWAWV